MHGKMKPITIYEKQVYNKIAITVDFSHTDSIAISHAIAQGGKHAEYILIHCVETAGALLMEGEIADRETSEDLKSLGQYAHELKEKGYNIHTSLGYGNPKKSIPEIVNKEKADLLVMGAHGHKGLKDIIFGTTVETVRHKVNIPVLVIKDK